MEMVETREIVRILIVDDDPAKLTALEGVFDGMRVDVVKATSGKEALRLLLDIDFAVVLLDVKMPVMDGYETAEIIRSIGRTKNTPIIFITAASIDETNLSRGYSLGVVDYVNSPISAEILRAKVSVFADLFSVRNQLHKIVESSAEGILIVSKEMKVLLANPAAEKLFERPAASLIGNPFVFPVQNNTEIEFLRKDGEPLFLEMQAVDIEWEGEPAYLLTMHDITQRKRDVVLLEIARDELEKKVDEVEERTYELSMLYNLSHYIGRVLEYDDVFRLVATSISEVLDFALVGILHSTESRNEIVIIRTVPVGDSVIEDACDILINEFNTAGDAVFDRDNYDLKIMDIFSEETVPSVSESIASHASTTLDAGEQLIGAMTFISTGKNIFTEEQISVFQTIANEAGIAIQRLDSLIQSEELRIKAIIFNISEGVLFINEDGKTILSNPAADSIMELYALRRNTDTDAVKDVVREAIGKPGSHAEAICVMSHGDLERTYHLEATTVPESDGAIAGTAVIIRDITKERDLERLRSSFLSSISHELRTPLTSVKEYIAILLDGYGGDLSKEQLDCLNTAKRNTERLQALIEDLLTVTRIEAHGFNISRKDILFSSTADVCIKSLLPAARERGIGLEYDSTILPSIYADPLRIGQVLTNLLDNALKFTPPKGSVKIEAKVKGDYLLVSVSDTGRGIPKEETPHIFDLFYKVVTGGDYGSGGTGLGLYISSEMVTAHNGKLWVESKLGQGTTFFFTLPISSKKAGLSEFLSDAVEHSLRRDLPLSVVVLNFARENVGEKVFLRVRQNLGPEDRIIRYGKYLEKLVIVFFVDKKHLEPTRQRVISGVLNEINGVESVSFSKDSRTLRVVLEKVLKAIAAIQQHEE